MFRYIVLGLGTLVRLLRSRQSLLFENLVLRQQLAALKRRHPRPRIRLLDKLFWVAVRRFWSEWKQSLIVVTPETVVRWHRAGFRLYWRLISQARPRVASGLRRDSAGRIIVTIGLPDPDQLFTCPYLQLMVVHWFLTREKWAHLQADLDRIQAPFAS